MSTLLHLLDHVRETGEVSALLDAVPFGRFMGIVFEASGDELIGRLPFADHLVGNPAVPALHGGAVGSLLESTAIALVLRQARPATLPKTINITVDYLRPARLEDTFASGRVTRQGRRVATVHVEAYQSDRDRLVASAKAHFLIRAADR